MEIPLVAAFAAVRTAAAPGYPRRFHQSAPALIGGVDTVTRWIRARCLVQPLLAIGSVTFLLGTTLDNLTTTIVIIS